MSWLMLSGYYPVGSNLRRIRKFQADASYPEQAEIMIALVLTGHVGSNLHKHRLQLHLADFADAPPAVVHQAKARDLPNAIASINLVAATLDKISNHAPSASHFYKEMHASVVLALQLKEFLLKLPGITNKENLERFVKIGAENQQAVDNHATLISEGYNALAAFATTEFNRIWEN